MIVVVDNRDSYTYNLVQLLRELSTHEVRVVDAGDPAAITTCLGWIAADAVAGIVISPGPGHPANPADFAGSAAVVDAVLSPHSNLPLFGVCLGHQGIALHYGARVVAAPEAKHGWRSPITHDGSGIFAGIPQSSLVTRYHSLAVEEPLPAGLRVTARSEDGVVQGFAVEGRPVWGVQFHPESIASEHGRQLVANFVAAVDAAALGDAAVAPSAPPTPTAAQAPAATRAATGAADLHVASRVVRGPQPDGRGAAESAAVSMYRDVLRRDSASVWVDVPDETGRQAQWSILADDAPICDGHPAAGDGHPVQETGAVCSRCEPARVLRLTGPNSFETVSATLERMRPVGEEGLPFRGGLLGYFGYELGLRMLGVEQRGSAHLRSERGAGSGSGSGSGTGTETDDALPTSSEAGPGEGSLPDTWWLDPRRAVLVERATGAITVVATASRRELAEAGAEYFRDELAEVLARAARTAEARASTASATADATADVGVGESASPAGDAGSPGPAPDRAALISGTWHTSREQYAADIERCREHLLDGDSYELCLTNEFRPAADPDPLDLFLELRATDPAPYAALLEFDDGAVVSASPERFLRGTAAGEYETKPIKGTAARASDPLLDAAAARDLTNDPKVFAENLMIVDLLRNDLGRVCTPGSVRVPSLMAVESYTTVHQLVTTVRGSAPDVPPLEVVRALFPGGSMTGAPKLRSVELLRDIERRNRGVYAGALGVLGADRSTELSIVIRTAVRDARGWSVGAGGAIVLASDPEAETLEVELKASALRRAFARATKG